MRTVFVDKRRIQLRLCFYVKQGEINSYKISEVTQIEFQGSERRHRRHKSSLAVCQSVTSYSGSYLFKINNKNCL